jgi:hypothetical protein
VTPAIFISPSLRSRQIPNPEAWIILKSVWGNLIKHGSWDANVGDDHLAAQQSSRQQQVPRLFAKESYRQDGRNGTQRFAGIAHQAAGNINCNDW